MNKRTYTLKGEKGQAVSQAGEQSKEHVTLKIDTRIVEYL